MGSPWAPQARNPEVTEGQADRGKGAGPRWNRSCYDLARNDRDCASGGRERKMVGRRRTHGHAPFRPARGASKPLVVNAERCIPEAAPPPCSS